MIHQTQWLHTSNIVLFVTQFPELLSANIPLFWFIILLLVVVVAAAVAAVAAAAAAAVAVAVVVVVVVVVIRLLPFNLLEPELFFLILAHLYTKCD